MIKKAGKYFWYGIAAAIVFVFALFFQKGSNEEYYKEAKKAKKKVQEKEKIVKKAETEYSAAREELERVRAETDKFLARKEAEGEEIHINSDDADKLLNDILGRDG